MKELIYLRSEKSNFKDNDYTIYTFIDPYNYRILRATNLTNSKLLKGNKYMCDLDVKYNSKKKEFVFYVTKVNE